VSRSPFRRFTISLEVCVTDARAAIKAARDDAEEKANRRGIISDTRDAVHWLLDPGSLFEKGIEIENSSIEEVRL
jgi:hypothetical protein